MKTCHCCCGRRISSSEKKKDGVWTEWRRPLASRKKRRGKRGKLWRRWWWWWEWRQKSLERQERRLKALAEKRVLTDPLAFVQDKRLQLDYVQQKLLTAANAQWQEEQRRFAALAAKPLIRAWKSQACVFPKKRCTLRARPVQPVNDGKPGLPDRCGCRQLPFGFV